MAACTDRGARRASARGGFSLVEVIIVIVIAGVLLGIMFSSFQNGAAERNARSARDTYRAMAMRARAAAIQRGVGMQIRLAAAGSRIVLAQTSPANVLEVRDLRREFGTTTTISSGDSVMVCYDPRGFGDGCSLSTLPQRVTFTVRGQSASAVVQVLGMVEAK